jgi:hypothetical protein
VSVVLIREFATLADGLKTKRFDQTMVRLSDCPARVLRDRSHAFVASAKPEGHCLITVPRDTS